MNRVRSREVVMELFYQMDIQSEFDVAFSKRMLAQYVDEKLDDPYVFSMVECFLSNKVEVDEKIEKHLKGWTVERLAKLDLAILRMAVAEMCFLKEVPYKVSINEAVKMAQKYVDEKSGKFVNGILGHFAEEE